MAIQTYIAPKLPTPPTIPGAQQPAQPKPTTQVPYNYPGTITPLAQSKQYFNPWQQQTLGAPQQPQAPAQPQPATVQSNQQGNEQVLQAAQQQALQGFQSPTAALVNRRSDEYLMDPNLGNNPRQGTQAAIDAFNAQSAKGVESVRQSTATVANTGKGFGNLLDVVLNQNRERAGLKSDLETQAAEKERQNYLSALAEGRSTVGMQQGIQNQNLANLVQVRGAGEGERAQETAQTYDMAKLNTTFGQDMAKMVASQDWTGVQNQLDREAATAKQKGDIKAQKDIQTRQIAADMERLKTTQGFEGLQNELQQKLQLAMQSNDITAQKEIQARQLNAQVEQLKTTQNWQGVQNLLAQKFELAKQMNDLEGQKEIQAMQTKAEVERLTQTQNWTGIQNELDRAAAVAKQEGDLAGQKELAMMQINADAERLAQTQNWQGVQNDVQRSFEAARQGKDIEAQSSIVERQLALDKWKQENGQTFTAGQAALNRSLEISLKDKDAVSQANLMKLKYNLDTNTLMKQQDFQATQNDLNRKLEESIKKGDWQSAVELTQLKGAIDAQAQEKQLEFSRDERIATQAYATDTRISTQDFEGAMKYYDRQTKLISDAAAFQQQKELQVTDIQAKMAELNATFQNSAKTATDQHAFEIQKSQLEYKFQAAMQSSQQTAQKELVAQKALLDLKMQTQQMDDATKKMYLGAQLDEAKAQNDVKRQTAILNMQYSQDLSKINKEQGFTQANMYLQQQLNAALKAQDNVQANYILQKQQQFLASEAVKDRALDQQKIALEGRSIDIQGQQVSYDQLQEAVKNGQIAPDAANDFLQAAMTKYGIKIEPPDELAAQREADRAYNIQLYTYGKTHPDAVVTDANGNAMLKPEAIQAYNDFVNGATYGGTGDIKDTVAKIETGEIPITALHDVALTNPQKYSALIGATAPFDYAGSGVNKVFNNGVPAANSLVTMNNRVYQVGDGTMGTIHGNQFFWVKDIDTGELKKVIAGRGIV